MKDLFENAYFGKPYKTRDGRKAIYVACDDKDFNSHPHQLIQEDTKRFHYHNDFGQVLVKYDDIESEIYDIVSEWPEEINEEELAKQYVENSLFGNKTKKQIAYCAYLKGYKSAKEE